MGFESGESQTPPRATAAQAQPLPRGNRTRERKSDAGSSSRRQPLLFLPYSSDAGPHSRLLCQKQPSSVSSTLPPGEGSRSSSRPLFSYPLPSTSASLLWLHLLMLPPGNAFCITNKRDLPSHPRHSTFCLLCSTS